MLLADASLLRANHQTGVWFAWILDYDLGCMRHSRVAMPRRHAGPPAVSQRDERVSNDAARRSLMSRRSALVAAALPTAPLA